MSVLTELVGVSESCKTAFLFEIYRWHIFNTTDLKVQTGNDEVSVGAARGVRGGAAAGACVAWFFVSPKGFPFLAPATHVPLGCFGCPSGGVVLVAIGALMWFRPAWLMFG